MNDTKKAALELINRIDAARPSRQTPGSHHVSLTPIEYDLLRAGLVETEPAPVDPKQAALEKATAEALHAANGVLRRELFLGPHERALTLVEVGNRFQLRAMSDARTAGVPATAITEQLFSDLLPPKNANGSGKTLLDAIISAARI